MTRLKLIKKLTSDWFDSHKFVNQVYWGDFIRWYADKQIEHSSVVITPIRVTEVTRSKRSIQLQITYADRVYSDFRNLDEVHSDADRTLADFILSASNDKELRKFLTGLTSGNIEYFTNRTGDLIAGATMSVSLNVFSDANSCEIPVDFAPQPAPFECLDATVNVNQSDGTLIASVTAPSGGVEPYNVADSVITVNSATFASVKATDSLNVPIVDSNGDAVATTVVGGEVQVDDLPCEAPADEWIRPADWLDMPTLTSSDDEIALLHAVWDNDSNFAALRCATTTGDYQVDWGDGTTTTHASNVVAEHQYDYSTYDTGGATLSSRGYKQAMIRITPLTGDLATFSSNFRYTGQNQTYATGYLDVLLSMPNANAGQSILFQSSLVSNRYMEQVEILNSGGMTSALNMFRDCTSLQSVPLFDTSSVTSMLNMFNGCTSLQSVPLFDTSSVTTMQSMFNSCTSLQSVPLFDTSSVTTIFSMFNGCTSLQSVPLFDTSSVTNTGFVFRDCTSLQSVPLFDTNSSTRMDSMFLLCRSLQKIPAFNTVNVTNMASFVLGCNSHSKTDIICRVSVDFRFNQLSRDGIVNIFNNLLDRTSLASANINISGNYGVADLSTADLEIATDKNWTVTT